MWLLNVIYLNLQAVIGNGLEAGWPLSPSFTEHAVSVLNDIKMPASWFKLYLDTVGLIIQKKIRLIEFEHTLLTPFIAYLSVKV